MPRERSRRLRRTRARAPISTRAHCAASLRACARTLRACRPSASVCSRRRQVAQLAFQLSQAQTEISSSAGFPFSLPRRQAAKAARRAQIKRVLPQKVSRQQTELDSAGREKSQACQQKPERTFWKRYSAAEATTTTTTTTKKRNQCAPQKVGDKIGKLTQLETFKSLVIILRAQFSSSADKLTCKFQAFERGKTG